MEIIKTFVRMAIGVTTPRILAGTGVVVTEDVRISRLETIPHLMLSKYTDSRFIDKPQVLKVYDV
jgi:hypothetical protein